MGPHYLCRREEAFARPRGFERAPSYDKNTHSGKVEDEDNLKAWRSKLDDCERR